MSPRDRSARLRQMLLSHIGSDSGPLGGAGVFHARAPQELHAVPIHAPSVGLVLSGRKEIVTGTREVAVRAGELMFLPAGSNLFLRNLPGSEGNCYLALMFAFPREVQDRFQRDYGARTRAWDQRPVWSGAAPAEVVLALEQWVGLYRSGPVDALVAGHRAVELLLLLAQAGLAGNLLLDQGARWRDRVAQLISLDPARDWEVADVGARLALSESTLRRYLRAEECSFRELLEEVRLVAGLSLLQETFWPIARVALEVGYDSQSRFSERFKRRFGVSPSLLRRTRVESQTTRKGAGVEPAESA